MCSLSWESKDIKPLVWALQSTQHIFDQAKLVFDQSRMTIQAIDSRHVMLSMVEIDMKRMCTKYEIGRDGECVIGVHIGWLSKTLRIHQDDHCVFRFTEGDTHFYIDSGSEQSKVSMIDIDTEDMAWPKLGPANVMTLYAKDVKDTKGKWKCLIEMGDDVAFRVRGSSIVCFAACDKGRLSLTLTNNVSVDHECMVRVASSYLQNVYKPQWTQMDVEVRKNAPVIFRLTSESYASIASICIVVAPKIEEETDIFEDPVDLAPPPPPLPSAPPPPSQNATPNAQSSKRPRMDDSDDEDN